MNIYKFIVPIAFFTAHAKTVHAINHFREKTESVMETLAVLDAPERLGAFSLLYEQALTYGPNVELEALHLYLREAVRQNNETETGRVMMQMLLTFRNYKMDDSLRRYYPESMAFFEKHEQWGRYYYAALLQIQSYIHTNHPITAMNNARRLYREAAVHDSDYGRGATALILGDVHYKRGDNDEALHFMGEAIDRLENEPDPAMLFYAYDRMWEIYSAGERLHEALEILAKWEKYIEKYFVKSENDNGILEAENSCFRCWCGISQVYAKLRMFPQAREYLSKAEDIADGKPVYENGLCMAKSIYYRETGDYETAIRWYRRTIPENWNYTWAQEGYDAASTFAGLLVAGGHLGEATEVYGKALVFAEKIRTEEIESKFRELENIYQFDQMELRARNLKILASIIIVALLSMFTSYFVYGCRLSSKNRVLSKQLREISRLRTWQLANLPQTEKNGENHNENTGTRKNEEIMWLACRRMVEEKLFCDPALNRKQLADLLGTNENYLAAAIRNVNEGQTVGDFINSFRLAYACELLIGFPHMKLETLAQESGFMTRSTLFRLFLKKFGMSPSKYRSEQAKEKKAT